MHRILMISIAIGGLMFSSSCTNEGGSKGVDEMQGRIDSLEKELHEMKESAPGLGTLMSQIQIHHTKLYLAIQEDNRDLIKYLQHELEEGFEHVVENHGQHDGVNIKELANNTVLPALEELEDKVMTASKEELTQAFEYVTVTCNKCHKASGHEFIRIREPQSQTYLNQDFSKP